MRLAAYSGIRPHGIWIKSNEWNVLIYTVLCRAHHQSASIVPLSLNKVYLLALWMGIAWKSCMSRFNHSQNWTGCRGFAAFVRRGVWELNPTWMLIEIFFAVQVLRRGLYGNYPGVGTSRVERKCFEKKIKAIQREWIAICQPFGVTHLFWNVVRFIYKRRRRSCEE